MNENFSRLRQEQKQESEQHQTQEQKSEAREFASVDEMLQHDASQITVPPAIAVRLNESISREPKPEKSWWQRFFKK
jgi:hypothetical protein